ncbi:MAG: hypothetical protein E7231_12265 [Cellulosilyticum sp.]|nr:hypothetical protein [Cellulosilyticum sp.]
MLLLKTYFTIDIDLLILVIGAYMAFVQSSNLAQEKMKREGRFLQVIGYGYLVVGVVGILIWIS